MSIQQDGEHAAPSEAIPSVLRMLHAQAQSHDEATARI